MPSMPKKFKALKKAATSSTKTILRKVNSKSEPLVPAGSKLEQPGATAMPAAMEGFFAEVKQIESMVGTIRHRIEQLETAHGDNLSSVTLEERRASQARVDHLTADANALVSEVKQRLKSIDKANRKLATGPSDLRLRQNVHGALGRKFVEAVERFQQVQTNAKQQYRERAERQYRTVHPHASAAQIEEALLASSDGKDDIFAQQAIGADRIAARRALTDLQLQHRQIQALEASIADLHQLFVEMSVLVEAQGEQLDRIEYNTQQTVDYTDQAVGELKGATSYQKRVRKKRLILVILGVIIVIIIVAVVAL